MRLWGEFLAIASLKFQVSGLKLLSCLKMKL